MTPVRVDLRVQGRDPLDEALQDLRRAIDRALTFERTGDMENEDESPKD